MKRILLFLIIFSCGKKNNLADMNNVPFPEYKELKQIGKSKETFRILILGNSITSHPKAPKIGWYQETGMAASVENKDYVHLLFNKLKDNNRSVIIRYANYSELERNPESLNFNSGKIKKLRIYKPDLLIIQLGDNVAKENTNIFEVNTITLIKNISSKNTILLEPFFNTKDNVKALKEIAKNTNSVYLETNAISSNPENKAINDRNNRKRKKEWKVEGIGIHPGDHGMMEITKLIYENIPAQFLHL